MSFQPTKCKTIRISRKTRHNVTYLYHLHDVALDFVTEIKYLGVIITVDLRWNRHIADEQSEQGTWDDQKEHLLL